MLASKARVPGSQSMCKSFIKERPQGRVGVELGEQDRDRREASDERLSGQGPGRAVFRLGPPGGFAVWVTSQIFSTRA